MMTAIRDEVVAAVRTRTPVDDREEVAIEEFLAALERLGQDPFDEHANPVHVTASALIVGKRGLVLHRHKVLGTWVPPGGHIDPGEQPWEAAVREAHEETGLPVWLADDTPNLVHVDVHPGPHGHTHLDLRYLLNGDDADPSPPPDESQEVVWCSWVEALTVAERSVTGIVAHLSALLTGPSPWRPSRRRVGPRSRLEVAATLSPAPARIAPNGDDTHHRSNDARAMKTEAPT